MFIMKSASIFVKKFDELIHQYKSVYSYGNHEVYRTKN